VGIYKDCQYRKWDGRTDIDRETGRQKINKDRNKKKRRAWFRGTRFANLAFTAPSKRICVAPYTHEGLQKIHCRLPANRGCAFEVFLLHYPTTRLNTYRQLVGQYTARTLSVRVLGVKSRLQVVFFAHSRSSNVHI
jgi:hypothetical protein